MHHVTKGWGAECQSWFGDSGIRLGAASLAKLGFGRSLCCGCTAFAKTLNP